MSTSGSRRERAYRERPLCSLSRASATALVDRLHAPDQRFARAFYRYWHEQLGHSAEEAARRTAAELDQAAQGLLDDFGDPRVHTIGFEREARYEPFGIFAFRDLQEHARGAVLARQILYSRVRYPGRIGIGHSVALLDAEATREALTWVLLSIAQKALAGAYSFVFFFSSDLRLAGLYRRFGMEFPADLRFPDSAHLVGVFDVKAPANLARVARASERFGIERIAGTA
jgi:hypothetical protein